MLVILPVYAFVAVSVAIYAPDIRQVQHSDSGGQPLSNTIGVYDRLVYDYQICFRELFQRANEQLLQMAQRLLNLLFIASYQPLRLDDRVINFQLYSLAEQRLGNLHKGAYFQESAGQAR